MPYGFTLSLTSIPLLGRVTYIYDVPFATSSQGEQRSSLINVEGDLGKEIYCLFLINILNKRHVLRRDNIISFLKSARNLKRKNGDRCRKLVSDIEGTSPDSRVFLRETYSRGRMICIPSHLHYNKR